MSAQVQVNQQEAANQKPVGNSTAQPPVQASSNNPTMGCGGSNFFEMAASLYQFGDFLNELSVNEGKINAGNTQIRLAESKVEQQTTKEEYLKQSMGQWMDMGKDLLGAAVSFGTVLFENKDISVGGKSFSNAGTLNKEFDLQNDQLAELRGINTAAKDKLINPSSGQIIQGRGAVLPEAERVKRLDDMAKGDLIPNNKAVLEPSAKKTAAEEALAQEKIMQDNPGRENDWPAYFETDDGDLETGIVRDRMELNGDFASPEGKQALEERMNQADRDNGIKAIRDANMGDPAQQAAVQKIKDESDRQISDLLKKNETTMTGINANRARAKMGFEIAKGLGDSGFDAAKANYTREVGAIKAENQAATFSNQTLQQMQQSLSQQIKENLDTMRSALSALVSAASRA